MAFTDNFFFFESDAPGKIKKPSSWAKFFSSHRNKDDANDNDDDDDCYYYFSLKKTAAEKTEQKMFFGRRTNATFVKNFCDFVLLFSLVAFLPMLLLLASYFLLALYRYFFHGMKWKTSAIYLRIQIKIEAKWKTIREKELMAEAAKDSINIWNINWQNVRHT